MGNYATITEDDFDGICLCMTLDIGHLNLYEKSKAIVKFCDKDIKRFEEDIDRHIESILGQNGINVQNNSKSALKQAFARLNAKGKAISVKNLFHPYTEECELVKQDKYYTIVLENGETLEVGVEIKEIKL